MSLPVLVDPARTAPLRRRVLRPHQSVEEVVAAMDAPGTVAVGVLDGDEVVACVLAAQEPCPDPLPDGPTWRLRGMATAPEHRGGGLGRLVLGALLTELGSRGAQVVWCNARTPARSLYERAGFRVVGDPWDDPDIGPHVRMWTSLEHAATADG